MGLKKILKIISSIMFILMLVVFFYTLFNYQELRGSISESLQKNSFYGIAVITFLLEVFPQVIGGDLPLLTGGLIGLNIFWVFVIVSIASSVAGMLQYSIGFFFGKKISLLYMDEISYNKYRLLFNRKGKFALTLTALTPVPYIPAIAGVFKMHPYDFLLYGVLMRVIRFAAVAYLFLLIFS